MTKVVDADAFERLARGCVEVMEERDRLRAALDEAKAHREHDEKVIMRLHDRACFAEAQALTPETVTTIRIALGDLARWSGPGPSRYREAKAEFDVKYPKEVDRG